MKNKKILLGREYLSVYKLIYDFFLSFVKLVPECCNRGTKYKSEERFKESSLKNNIESLAAKAALPLLKGEYCVSADFLNYKLISGFIFTFFHAVIPANAGIHFKNFNLDSRLRGNDISKVFAHTKAYFMYGGST